MFVILKFFVHLTGSNIMISKVCNNYCKYTDI